MKTTIYLTRIGITFLISLLGITSAVAQITGNKISGLIKTSDGKPVSSANIFIKELNRTTIADGNGAFLFDNVGSGSYTLKVTYVGTKGSEKMIEVSSGKIAHVDIVLEVSTENLNEVKINAGKTLNTLPVQIGKAGLRPLDMPQSIGVVSSQVIRDQQVNKLGDAIRNVSGVSLTQTRGGVGETFSARGYSIGINGGAGSIFKNGVLVNTAGFPEASTLESVEVLKGSAALLYGNVSGGVVINMITKKPKFENGGEVSMRYGSYNEYKPTADIYGPISKDLAFRTIATYENDNSYRNGVKTERAYVNPSLLYNLGQNTTMTFEGDFLRSNLTPDWGIGSLNSGRAIPTMVPRSQFINTSWAYSNMNQYTSSLTVDHRVNENWDLKFISSAQGTNINSYGSSLPNTVNATGDWNMGLARANTHEGDYTGQAFITGRFKTGGIGHQLLVGTDVAKVINVTNGYSINGQNISSYIYNKVNTINLAQYAQRSDVPNAVDTSRTTAPVYRFGSYVQDLVSLTSKFKVLAGVRWSWQQTYQTNIDYLQKGTTGLGTAPTRYDRAFSPKAALIYQPFTTTSLYTSYSNNFIVNTGTDISGQALKPSTVDQYEAGIKNELFDGKLTANFSIYRIINSSLAVADPTDINHKILSGQTTSDGLEVDVTGNLNKNLYFIVGYGYNNARYTKTSGLKGSNIEGEQLVINPKHTANASLFYTFSSEGLRGVKVGASAFYTGSRLAGYNNVVGQSQAFSRLLPVGGFATMDLSAGYTFRKVSILAQISNITNTLNYLIHDNYSITPIAPRQFLTTVAYKF